jgi:uncharacterized RDD family membrane protein YckC
MNMSRDRDDDYDDDRERGIRSMPYGNPGLRFAAFFIDQILLAMLFFPLGVVLGIVLVASNGGRPPDPATEAAVQLAINVLAIFVTWFYFAFMESSSFQATFGKMAVGLRVTDLNGERLSFGHATGRFFAKILSNLTCCIGYLMILTSDKRQGLHDSVAKTLVLEGKPGGSTRTSRPRRYDDPEDDRDPYRGSEGIRKDRDR